MVRCAGPWRRAGRPLGVRTLGARRNRNADVTTQPGGSAAKTTSSGAPRPPPPLHVLDQVIAVFRERKPEDWRKLVAYSRTWRAMAADIFERCPSVCRVGVGRASLDGHMAGAIRGPASLYLALAEGAPVARRQPETKSRAQPPFLTPALPGSTTWLRRRARARIWTKPRR